MFKSCRNLFDLSRKLGSVVIGLGLAGVLFAGQVSATPPWSQDEQNALFYVVEELVNSGESWTWNTVAERLNSRTNGNRSVHACYAKWVVLAQRDARYARVHNPGARFKSGSWTDAEEACLIAAVTEHDLRSFPAISEHLRELGFNRNSGAYVKRWYRKILPNHPDLRKYSLGSLSKFDNPEFSGSGRRSKFTPEEDATIIRLVRQYSRNSGVIPREAWEAIERSLGNRKTARQCKNRYYDYLKTPPNATPFTTEENESLIRLVQEVGEKEWATIAGLLGNRRTATQCKIKYRHLLQNRNRVPIPQINTPLADSAPTPITGSDNHATDTSNAATQSRSVFPLLSGLFSKININFFLNR